MSKTAWLIAGGGLKGAFDLPILDHHLSSDGFPDYIIGVSVGAINGAAVACDEFDALEKLYADLRGNGVFGIKNIMRPSIFGNRGLYSLNPLRGHLKKYIDPAKLNCTFGTGIVSRQTSDYYQPLFDQSSNKARMHQAILASSAIAGFHEPYYFRIDGEKHLCSDGGHIHVLPTIPWDVTKVVAIFHKGIDFPDYDKSEVNSLGEAFEWMLSLQFGQQVVNDFEALKHWAAHPANSAVVYAPTKPLGALFDASKQAIQERIGAGLEALRYPMVL